MQKSPPTQKASETNSQPRSHPTLSPNVASPPKVVLQIEERLSGAADAWAIWRVTLAGLPGSSDSRAHPGSASISCRPQVFSPCSWSGAQQAELVVEGRKFQWLIRFSLLGCGGGTEAKQERRKGRESKYGTEHTLQGFYLKKASKRQSSGKGK